MVKVSASRAEDPGFAGIFPGRVILVTSILALQWIPCQVPGVIGSVLGLVGPVSVYSDWVRWKVGSATSTSVWRHVKLSRSVPEIHSHVAGTLSNQPTNQQTSFINSSRQNLNRTKVHFEVNGSGFHPSKQGLRWLPRGYPAKRLAL